MWYICLCHLWYILSELSISRTNELFIIVGLGVAIALSINLACMAWEGRCLGTSTTAFPVVLLNWWDAVTRFLTLKQIDVFWKCNFVTLFSITVTQQIFSWHCVYWWQGALAPGLEKLHWWLCTHAFLPLYGSCWVTFKKYKKYNMESQDIKKTW